MSYNYINEGSAVWWAITRDLDGLTVGTVHGTITISRPCRVDICIVAEWRSKSVNLLKGEPVETPVLALNGSQWRSGSRRDKRSKTDRVSEFHFSNIIFGQRVSRSVEKS